MQLKKLLPSTYDKRPLFVSTNAYRRYWLQSLAKIHGDLLATVEQWVKPGMIVCDVGANCGLFAFPAAIRSGPAGRIFAFEPDLTCLGLMQKSLAHRIHGEAEVSLCPWAVADRCGFVQFELSSYRSAANSIAGYGRFSEGGKRVMVPVFTLDSMLELMPPPSLIKIDVEGAEHLVLRGADSLVCKYRPIVLMEISGGEVGLETAEFLRKRSYVWRAACAPKQTPFNDEGFKSPEIAAVPKEFASSLS